MWHHVGARPASDGTPVHKASPTVGGHGPGRLLAPVVNEGYATPIDGMLRDEATTSRAVVRYIRKTTVLVVPPAEPPSPDESITVAGSSASVKMTGVPRVPAGGVDQRDDDYDDIADRPTEELDLSERTIDDLSDQCLDRLEFVTVGALLNL